MKTFLTFAAAVTALATAPTASAHDASSGHWEWRNQPTFGAKTTAPSRIRVWVKGNEPTMANCDCSMMNTDTGNCMIDISGKSRAPSAG